MTPGEAWELLGVAPTGDVRAAKRAYAARLKRIDVDADPDAFIRLREALETAQRWGTESWESGADDWDEEGLEPAEEERNEGEEGEGDDYESAPYIAGHFRFDPIGGGHIYLGGRPALPAVDDAALEARAALIDRMLFDDEAPDVAAIGREGSALLKSEAMAGVDAAVAVEAWLAHAIAAATPRSDPLAVPAINHFGWRSPKAGWKRPPAVDAVLERYDDRVWLAGPAITAHATARAELLGPPRARSGWLGLGLFELGPFELGKARHVARFLDVVRREHPSVEQDLNSASVAWWDRYLAGRRPPGNFWLLVLTVPPVLLLLFLAIVFGTEPAPLSDGALFKLYGAGVVATLLLMAGYAEFQFRLRNRDDHSFAPLRPADWIWAPLLLALPMAAVALPASAITAVVVALLAIAASLWGALHARAPFAAEFGDHTRRLRIPIVAGLASLLLLLPLTPAAATPLAVPLGAMCLMGALGYGSAAAIGEGVLHKIWTRAAAVLLALHVGAGVALLALLPDARLPEMVAAPVLLIAAHWLAAGRYCAPGRIEWGLRLSAVTVYFTRGTWGGEAFAVGAFAAVAFYGLAMSAVCLGLALRHELADQN